MTARAVWRLAWVQATSGATMARRVSAARRARVCLPASASFLALEQGPWSPPSDAAQRRSRVRSRIRYQARINETPVRLSRLDAVVGRRLRKRRIRCVPKRHLASARWSFRPRHSKVGDELDGLLREPAPCTSAPRGAPARQTADGKGSCHFSDNTPLTRHVSTLAVPRPRFRSFRGARVAWRTETPA